MCQFHNFILFNIHIKFMWKVLDFFLILQLKKLKLRGNLPKVTQLPSSKGSIRTGALPLRMRTRKPLMRYFVLAQILVA